MSEGPVPSSPNGAPDFPEGIMEELSSRLSRDDAPFLRHLPKQLCLQWADASDNRLGYTRFEFDHHELFRRRRLRGSPGPITIALHPRLRDDEKLYLPMEGLGFVQKYVGGSEAPPP